MARKIEFDRDKALHQSMMLFWKKGYENTSMQELVSTLEINRFSIYNSFGDKSMLFQQALEHYRTNVFERLNDPLRASDIPGKQRLDNYLYNFGKHITSRRGALGCMVQGSALSEVSGEKEIRKEIGTAFKSLQRALQQALQQAKEEDELNADCDVEIAAIHILCTLQGLIVLRKSRKGIKAIDAQVEFLRNTVAAW